MSGDGEYMPEPPLAMRVRDQAKLWQILRRLQPNITDRCMYTGCASAQHTRWAMCKEHAYHYCYYLGNLYLS